MENTGVRIRQANAVAEAWMSKFGESESMLSQQVIEMLRVLLFEFVLHVSDDDGAEGAPPISEKTLANLALALQRVESAAEAGATRERKVRQELAGKADAEAKRQGLSKDSAAALRAVLTGEPAHAT